MKQVIFLLVMAVAVLAAGCDYLKEAQKTGDSYQGRQETVNVQALDAVGYNGTAVRKVVDKVLDVNDQKQQELEKALK